jgi:hypothetical protein
LLKTFWAWCDTQLPDGTIIWTSPTGKTYKTLPGGRIFFPAWNTTTAELPPPRLTPVANGNGRGVMMPKRQHTRATDRTRRILEERALNDAYVAERNRPPPF